MGDRADCNLIVFGTTSATKYNDLTNIIEEYVDDIPETNQTIPNHWVFDQVNYSQLPFDIRQSLKASGLSYFWFNHSGDSYPAGVDLYDAISDEQATYIREDLDLLITVRDPIVQAIKWQHFMDIGITAPVRLVA